MTLGGREVHEPPVSHEVDTSPVLEHELIDELAGRSTLVDGRLREVPADATLIGVRPSEAYAAGHAPGALHAPANQTGFGNRVGWLLRAGDAAVLVAADEREAQHAARLLQGGALPRPQTRAEFARFMAEQTEMLGALVRASGATLN